MPKKDAKECPPHSRDEVKSSNEITKNQRRMKSKNERKIRVMGFERRKGGKGRNTSKKHGSGRSHLLFVAATPTADQALNAVSTDIRQISLELVRRLAYLPSSQLLGGLEAGGAAHTYSIKHVKHPKKEKGKG